jgi:hypothetical protein
MENFVMSLEFLGGVASFFALCHLLGLLLKLDKFYEDIPQEKYETIHRINN